MQWQTLVHDGPSMVLYKARSPCINSKIPLSFVQTYLLHLYYTRYHLKVDDVFEKNFWLTLKVSKDVRIKHDTSLCEDCRQYTSPPNVYMNKQKVDIVGSVDGPSIFCGRGADHPKRGTCKWGVFSKDITLNMSVDANKKLAMKRGFVSFVENKQVNWIASWKDPMTNEARYINVKHNYDHILEKFENARILHRNLKKVHTQMLTDIQSTSSEKKQQLALAVYMIEHLCIRVGNEKDVLHEADTVGCCTLRAHTHIYIKKPNLRIVALAFIGKDSVPFHKEFILPKFFFNVLQSLLSKKTNTDLFFDMLNPTTINRYIDKIVPNCTAKTFRTLKASTLFEKVLTSSDNVTIANRMVAQLLNHRRGESKKVLNLETSKKNYIDPRIYISYCKRKKLVVKNSWFSNDVKMIETLYSQTKESFLF